MDALQIEGCLASIRILVDTREQPSVRARRRYADMACPVIRRKLEYGDYTYDFDLPSGAASAPEGFPVNPSVVIERKMDLDELAGCFTHDRPRFKAEMERAAEHGAKMYLLVETASWESLLNGKYRSRFNSKAYIASLTAWMARYGIIPVFCKSETSGKLIKEILYRELKERLERGEYG